MIRTWLFGLFVGAALIGCCSPPGVLAPDAAEPNDNAAQAAAINGVFLGTMNEGDSADVFKFSAIKNERIIVRLAEIPNTSSFLDLRVRVTGSKSNVILTRNGALYRETAALEFIAPDDDEYVLQLEGFYTGPADSFCSAGRLRYQLSVERPSP
jgi:hypothetical protein